MRRSFILFTPLLGEVKMFPFEAPSTFSISGTTQSGKTTWLFRLLRNKVQLFGDNPPHSILYCYGIWQELFKQIESNISEISFHEGLPTSEQIENLISNKKHNIIILDDLMLDVVKNSEMELLFTRGAHHKKLTIIYLNQNMFCQGKNARSISLNCHYLILFQNLRDCSQIKRLGQQIFPNQSQVLVEAYKDCLQEPFGYLVIDLSPVTHQHYRLRTKIFPEEDTIVYQPHGSV